MELGTQKKRSTVPTITATVCFGEFQEELLTNAQETNKNVNRVPIQIGDGQFKSSVHSKVLLEHLSSNNYLENMCGTSQVFSEAICEFINSFLVGGVTLSNTVLFYEVIVKRFYN